jgi:ABC-type thiamin/hydroxymethylpyrimidine transport system permease subunit
MSLKTFHVVFITLSTLLAIAFGLWSFHDYRMHAGGAWAIVMTVLGFAAAVALVVYGIWFLKKLEDVSFK